MEIRINNILDLKLTNEDVSSFIDLFGTLKDEIQKQSKKVGFKKNGTLSIDLDETLLEFILVLCESANIMSETEATELALEQSKTSK